MHRRVLRKGCLGFVLVFLLVHNLSLISDTKALPVAPNVPNVSAQSAILIEPSANIVIYEKNAHIRLPMASTTKIMTAIVALEHISPSTTIEVSPLAVGIEGSSIYLYAGEHLSMEHLLYALLLESANDAAAAIAIAVAGSVEAFAELMNQKAAELGLNDTHFINPHGLDHEDHYTTASDLALLAAYCMQNEMFRTIVATQRITIPLHDTESARLLLNHNRLLRSFDGTIGLKTGFTKRSGRCLVSAVERDGMTLICVTLNAPDDWHDHRSLFEYGFGRYTSLMLLAAGAYSRSVYVIGNHPTAVAISNQNHIRVVLPKQHGEITWTCEAPRWLSGNIEQGQPIGLLVGHCDGQIIVTEPLIAQSSANANSQNHSFFRRIIYFFTKYFTKRS